ncbi:ribosomal-protein-alanine acetyltransferase [Eggerthia catenaformis OT 569 = DSM 20559]|uniref:[Ribosomal protein bS18]-alanine N-acetyltransferase n=1 Tax=Eggerthia catenaformis OT 569 = DSM 20559 TaxID=999415 RepID=M2PNX4_9FIRM|nr:ribosomal protein S18-alanine N-acetyltransferase [Eggerthia catenaformis]EMD17274.1 ribosomal-protein-alanine acetyltransferase [Eggerthia catenaformis OT 569 = DSM 20559]OUC51497.1 ribosomal-protein-alanine N-acetyltransferase RimI [Eggerthia catenaformis]
MLIRKMQVSDLEKILELENSLFSSPWSYQDYCFELNNPFGSYYVLEDQQIIGYLGLWITYDTMTITTIGVCFSEQGKGYGKYLLDFVLEMMNKNDIQTCTLEVRVSNDKAIHLYEKYGFQKKAVRKNYYADNHEDAYLMIKEG